MNIRSLLALQIAGLLVLSGCWSSRKCCTPKASSVIEQELNEFVEADAAEEIMIPEETTKF